MGTVTPWSARRSTISGSDFAASSLLTVTRTTSEPARARSATCLTVDATSAVSVLVIDCTMTGASLPTRTLPIFAVYDCLRLMVDIGWNLLQFTTFGGGFSPLQGQTEVSELATFAS